MGKNGPCYHCGVTSTPLWRNGPSEKPVLCNACGSRWRTKGTLTNYTPTHSRPELDHFLVPRATKVKIIPPKKNKQVNMIKRKLNHDNVTVGGMLSDYNRGYQKVMEEDTSNRSSSGSAISNESYTQFGVADAIEWDTIVPSKKRTCTGRSKASSIEKLTKDLYTILHEQKSSHLSGSSEEDLLFESEASMLSVEIGHGGVLIRHPSSIARDEESEASSLSVDNGILFPKKEGYSRFGNLSVLNESKGENFHSAPVDKNKRPIQQEKMNREKPHHEIIQMLASSDSPLCSIDLKNVLNFEELIGHFTDEEQRQLVQYLPSVDISGCPDSLKNMFDSDQFKESVSSFQKLLAEGVFNKSLVGVKTEDCKTLKRHALYNLTKWQWVEHYNLLKKCKDNSDNTQASAYEGPNISTSTKLGNIKRLCDDRNKNIPELRVTKTVKKKAYYEDKVSVYNDNSCFSPRSLFRLPSENCSFMLDSYHLEDEA